LNRERVLEIWKAAYERAVVEITDEAEREYAVDIRGTTTYALDEEAQKRANRDPVLVALGVTVSQGYHVRLR
jgi:hypothetical protein